MSRIESEAQRHMKPEHPTQHGAVQLGSSSESPRVRLTELQNEAAVIKVICHEDRPHATIAGSLFDPDSRTSLFRRNAVVRLLKLTMETRTALNWRRPVILRRRCITERLQQNG